MIIHDWYVDPCAGCNGDGSKRWPFKSLATLDAGIAYVNNDIHRIHLKAGSTLRERIPNRLAQTQVGLYLDVYGGSSPATLDITADCTDAWTLDANMDWYTATLGTNDWGDEDGKKTIGAVFEDGVVMKMAMYTSDHAALRSSLEGGGYSYDWTTGRVYMVPTDRCRHTWRVATQSSIVGLGAPGPFWNFDKVENRFLWNRTFEGIVFKGAKRHAVEVTNAGSKVSFRECGFYGIGGQQWADDNHYLGNAIEVCIHATLVEVKRCRFDQIFDTALTAQVYGYDEVVSDVVFEDNVIGNCGLSGIEVSTQAYGNANTATRNIVVRHNHIKGNRNAFAPEIYGGRYVGITVIYNADGTHLENIVIQKNLIQDQLYNGMTITGGNGVCISDNLIERCNLGIFQGICRDQPHELDFRQNQIVDCPTGIRTNSSLEQGSAIFRDNLVEGGDVAYSDGSPACAPVELTHNVLNATIAIEAIRTEGITGCGNTSSGAVDSRYDYLF